MSSWVGSNRPTQELTHTELLALDSRRATHLPTPPPTHSPTPTQSCQQTTKTHTQIKQQATAKRQDKQNTNKTTQHNIEQHSSSSSLRTACGNRCQTNQKQDPPCWSRHTHCVCVCVCVRSELLNCPPFRHARGASVHTTKHTIPQPARVQQERN